MSVFPSGLVNPKMSELFWEPLLMSVFFSTAEDSATGPAEFRGDSLCVDEDFYERVMCFIPYL